MIPWNLIFNAHTRVLHCCREYWIIILVFAWNCLERMIDCSIEITYCIHMNFQTNNNVSKASLLGDNKNYALYKLVLLIYVTLAIKYWTVNFACAIKSIYLSNSLPQNHFANIKTLSNLVQWKPPQKPELIENPKPNSEKLSALINPWSPPKLYLAITKGPLEKYSSIKIINSAASIIMKFAIHYQSSRLIQIPRKCCNYSGLLSSEHIM